MFLDEERWTVILCLVYRNSSDLADADGDEHKKNNNKSRVAMISIESVAISMFTCRWNSSTVTQ